MSASMPSEKDLKKAEEIMQAHYNEDGLRMDKTEARIATALAQEREDEREECLKIAENDLPHTCHQVKKIASQIRSRGGK